MSSLFPQACRNCKRARFRPNPSRPTFLNRRQYLKCPYCQHCDAPSGCDPSLPHPTNCGNCQVADKLPPHASTIPSDNDMRLIVDDVYEKLFKADDKDVTIRCNDGDTSAHKCILSAVSEAFAAMLQHDMREKADNVIVVADVNKASMYVFLRLVYTGNVDPIDWDGGGQMPVPLLQSIAKLAKRYMVPRVLNIATRVLKNRLEKAFIDENVQSFVSIFAVGIEEHIPAVRVRALQLAQHFANLKTALDAKEIIGDVQVELECIWPSQEQTPPSKRARFE